MKIFGGLSREKKAGSVVLVDITADSVAGGYAVCSEGQPPLLLYGQRSPIGAHADEQGASAMLRTLTALGEVLIREGAPALAQQAGSGTVSRIVVSLGAPWQETSVRTEHFENATPFVFTRGLIEQAMKKTGSAAGKVLSDESVIGTTVNGYRTNNPYGKKAHRAAAIILSSFVEQSVAENISTALRGLYHLQHIEFIAGSSLRYQALRAIFPHERTTLILDATSSFVSVCLVRNDLLVALSEIAGGDAGSEPWAKKVADGLAVLGKEYPLPRTIFLLAHEDEAEKIRAALTGAPFASLWLSDNPPKIVSVLPANLTDFVKRSETAPADLPLLLMALHGVRRTA